MFLHKINKYHIFNYKIILYFLIQIIMKRKPLVSVIMPVYNSEEYVQEAITSILNQTYPWFEFIIINDGSTDHSSEIIDKQKDDRIRFINHTINTGNYPRRNEGCKLAKGEYIFVMDSDDWASPERMEIQVETMEHSPNTVACGTAHVTFDGEYCFRPINPELSKINLIFNNGFLHPSLIIRKEILENINYYDENYRYASDYDLMCRIVQQGNAINLPDVLMKYRHHKQQISNRHALQQTHYADQIRLNYIQSCGFIFDPQQQEIFTHIMGINKNTSHSKIIIENFIENFEIQNTHLNCFNKLLLKRFLETIKTAYFN